MNFTPAPLNQANDVYGRRICAEFSDDHWAECEESARFAEECYAAMDAAGWLGITMLEELGGAGLGVIEVAIMIHATFSGGGYSAASALHVKLFDFRSVGSAGSRSSIKYNEWIGERVGRDDVWLTPMPGGTDLAGPFILDSSVEDFEYLGNPSYMPPSVALTPDIELDLALRERINARIRSPLTTRHVPTDIFAVEAVPRTLTGKKLALLINKLLLGHALAAVVNPDSMAQPESLGW